MRVACHPHPILIARKQRWQQPLLGSRDSNTRLAYRLPPPSNRGGGYCLPWWWLSPTTTKTSCSSPDTTKNLVYGLTPPKRLACRQPPPSQHLGNHLPPPFARVDLGDHPPPTSKLTVSGMLCLLGSEFIKDDVPLCQWQEFSAVTSSAGSGGGQTCDAVGMCVS